MRPLLLLGVAACCAFAADNGTFALRNVTIHSLAGPDVAAGTVVVRDGKIVGVGQKLAVPKDMKVIDGKGAQLYPGMIDSGSELGLIEINQVRETSDVRELGDLNPQLSALTAVNPSSEHFAITRVNGITSAISLPAGDLISGQASLLHLDGWTVDEMGIKRYAALHLTIPALSTGEGRGAIPYPIAKQNHDRRTRELNEFFDAARRYQKAKDVHAADFRTDLKLEAMLPVIEGKSPVFVTAVRESEIREAISLYDRQKIKMILGGCGEAYKVISELKSRNIPVVLGPTLSLPLNEDDPYDRQFTVAFDLFKAGIPFAFGSFHEGEDTQSRNLPYQAAVAVAFGLPHDEALKALTVNAARIWGVDSQLGTIEEGKWADFVLTDGDPLDVRTEVKQVFIKGRPVDMETRQKQLYEKYKERP